MHSLAAWIIAVALGCLGVWAYYPTLCRMIQNWITEPDYSHGFLVIPLVIFFLWARQDTYPLAPASKHAFGWGMLALAGILRYVAARYYLEPLDGWSIAFWIMGIVWIFRGFEVATWAAPAIFFLFFMVPLPFRMERALSVPLQTIAAKGSCYLLQVLGQPAVGAGNTIVLGEHHLEVERACSGLRIFVGIIALAYAYVIVVRRSWLERGILLAAAIPIALLSNVLRIVTTALVYQYISAEAGKRFAHDAVGLTMIAVAAGLFGLLLLYLKYLIQEETQIDMSEMVRDQGFRNHALEASRIPNSPLLK